MLSKTNTKMKTAVIIALLCGFLVVASIVEESEAVYSVGINEHQQHPVHHHRRRRRRSRRRRRRHHHHHDEDDVEIGTESLCLRRPI